MRSARPAARAEIIKKKITLSYFGRWKSSENMKFGNQVNINENEIRCEAKTNSKGEMTQR